MWDHITPEILTGGGKRKKLLAVETAGSHMVLLAWKTPHGWCSVGESSMQWSVN